jgi:hypothetical protein
MADERKAQDESQDEVKNTNEESEELSDEQLDEVAGGGFFAALAEAWGKALDKQADVVGG